MGCGYSFKCGKCNYSARVLSGVGFLFPAVYEEAIQKGKAGELGDYIERFLKEHPEGALDVSRTPYQCRKCGKLTSELNLAMYLPKSRDYKKEEKGRWSIAYPGEGKEYVGPGELKNRYKIFKIHPHYCEQCGSRMKKLSEKEMEAGVKCPSCGEMMQMELLFWD